MVFSMISVVIPTYNERENVGKLIEKIEAVTKKNKIKPQYIFFILIISRNNP